MIIGCLIILIIILFGLFHTRHYRKQEIENLDKRENPFLIFYPLSFKIIYIFKICKNSNIQAYIEYSKKISIILFMTSVLCTLCIILSFTEFQDSVINNYTITRPDVVENSQNFNLNVYKEGEDVPFNVNINIEPRQYTSEEVYETFEVAYDYILKNILNQNTSLEYVTSNLNLITFIPDYNINVDWYSNDYHVLDYDGTVYNSEFQSQHIESKTVELKAVFTYKEYNCEYPIEICVYPKEMGEEEQFKKSITNAISQEMSNSIFSDQVILPTNIDGSMVKYEYARTENITGVIIGICIMITIVLLVGMESQKKKEKEKRERQLKYDYSEFISKLILLTGAGMSVSRAWEKISMDYKRQRDVNATKVHFVYEEMVITYYQMKTGISEGKAFAEFGKRCNVKEYLKLGVLLEQNLKKGTKGLAQMLEKECMSAFEERKNMARKLGEEASTKLLLPMIMMLVIVMIIIIVPALLSFSL